jgi:hypothetical protein
MFIIQSPKSNVENTHEHMFEWKCMYRETEFRMVRKPTCPSPKVACVLQKPTSDIADDVDGSDHHQPLQSHNFLARG